jgi:hypothetical protein
MVWLGGDLEAGQVDRGMAQVYRNYAQDDDL